MARTDTKTFPKTAYLKPCAALALASLLGACATGENVDTLAAREATGSPFTQALATDYHAFAARERDQMYDWPDATHFADKGLRAARGDLVAPETLDDWSLSGTARSELSSARAALMTALDAGARDRRPQTAARAQTQFDCWVEQQAEGHQAEDIAACRTGFEQALAGLDAERRQQSDARPSDPTRRQLARADASPSEVTATQLTAIAPAEVTVHFGFDRRAISDAEAARLQQAVELAAATPDGRVVVTGHADTVGSDGYNMALSRDRAEAVRAALMARGVPARQIAVRAKGESEPAVATGDGVRERRNRRVEIAVE